MRGRNSNLCRLALTTATVARNQQRRTCGDGSELKLAAKEGVDTFITGEGPHWTFAAAEDLKLNIFYGGHYARQTFRVKALAEHLSTNFVCRGRSSIIPRDCKCQNTT
jgi:putative NIF3 family GTP cyclohydrolase 1 type 2